jgi:DNA-binding phage protein
LSGEKNPNFDIILKIMGALGTPVSCWSRLIIPFGDGANG